MAVAETTLPAAAPPAVPSAHPFEIAEVAPRHWAACNGNSTLSVLPDVHAARLFRRRAVKVNPAAGEPVRVEWAVAEVDGLRIYFDGRNVVVTRQDLQP